MHITRGLLVSSENCGRLEFRVVLRISNWDGLIDCIFTCGGGEIKTTAVLMTIVFSSAAGLANSVCSVRPVDNDLVKGRASRIVFPDGREFTVVGHAHGDAQIMTSDALADRSGANFDSLAREAIRKNRDDLRGISGLNPAQHAKNDAAFLRQELIGGKVGFIGLEQANLRASAKSQIQKVQRDFKTNYYYRALLGRTKVGKEEMEELLLSGSTGAMFVIGHDLPSARVVGIDTHPSRGEQWDKTEAKVSEYFNQFQKMNNIGLAKQWVSRAFYGTQPDECKKLVRKTVREIDENRFKVETFDRSWNDIIGYCNESFGKTLTELGSALKEKIQIDLDREKEMAKNLVSQSKNGIAFIGGYHLERVMGTLRSLCESSSAKAKSAPVQSTGRN